MNKSAFYTVISLSTLLIAYLIFGQNDKTPISEQQIQQLSKTFGDKFAQMRDSQQNTSTTPQPPQQIQNTVNASEDGVSVQAILGIIYKKPTSTWFIKAKDNKNRIEAISVKFKQYFLTELKFDSDQQPDFSHLPEGSKIASTSSMRFATFIIDGVEISVINLPGKQDVFSNVKRWMGQVGLNDKSPISMEFLDDKKTILVKMPK
ncbi:MAG: hypothetical protein COA86_11180 [Kangiella sp.]|nr:MAG: hypothetical protein COA86_11180 [Kangiella sp.]